MSFSDFRNKLYRENTPYQPPQTILFTKVTTLSSTSSSRDSLNCRPYSPSPLSSSPPSSLSAASVSSASSAAVGMMNTKPPPPAPASTFYTSNLLHAYPRAALTSLPPDSIYSPSAAAAAAAYASAAQGYIPFGAGDSTSAFYSPLNPSAAAENSDAWRSLSAQTAAAAAAAAWAYDPMAGYPYGTSYGGLDVRRKNATRESTSTLKAWLYEHIKNPYPTKGEKIMLAIITKMTLTQVSTWFANARRRLKKENKMQWSPRNRTGDDDDDDDDKNSDNDDVIIGDDSRRSTNGLLNDDDDEDIVVDAGNDDSQPHIPFHDSFRNRDSLNILRTAETTFAQKPFADLNSDMSSVHRYRPDNSRASDAMDTDRRTQQPQPQQQPQQQQQPDSSSSRSNSSCGISAAKPTVERPAVVKEKPRIWSLADVATSGIPCSRRSPPPVSTAASDAIAQAAAIRHHHHQQHQQQQQQHHAAMALRSIDSSTASIVRQNFQPWTNGFYLPNGGGAVGGAHHLLSRLTGYATYPIPRSTALLHGSSRSSVVEQAVGGMPSSIIGDQEPSSSSSSTPHKSHSSPGREQSLKEFSHRIQISPPAPDASMTGTATENTSQTASASPATSTSSTSSQPPASKRL